MRAIRTPLLALATEIGAREKMLLATTGVRLTLPWVGLPTVSAKLNNATAKSFKYDEDATPPLDVIRSLDVGFSLTPRVGRRSQIHLEVNYRDIGKKYPSHRDDPRAVHSARRLGLGMELDVSRAFFFRFGYGDGFGSAGIGVKTKKFQCDLTSYAVDTTSSQFRGRQDRRFVFSFSSGI